MVMLSEYAMNIEQHKGSVSNDSAFFINSFNW